MRALIALTFAFAVTNACRMQEEPTPSASTSVSSAQTAPPSARVRIVKAPDGDVTEAVRRALAEARGERRDLLVYVGASWCEPCGRFHAAAERGELDDALSSITLLEFDLDRDQKRLEVAGYKSQYIPLFALPNDEGRASGKQFDGSIKGPGAVADITPKLKRLLGK